MYPVMIKGATRTPCSYSGFINVHRVRTPRQNISGSPMSQRNPNPSRPYRVTISRIINAYVTRKFLLSDVANVRIVPGRLRSSHRRIALSTFEKATLCVKQGLSVDAA